MDEIIEQALQLFYSCYFQKPYLNKSLPKLIGRELTKEEWTKIYAFLLKKESNYGGCKKFSDRDSEGKHTCNDGGCEMAKLVDP